MLAKTKAAPNLKIFLSQFNLAKKPKAIRFTKVKGHAEAEDIQSGRIEQAHVDGNKQADSTANEGIMQLGSCTKNIANWCYHRHCLYIKFMQNIHDIIIAMMAYN